MVIAVAVVVFSMRNWTPVPVSLWSDVTLIVKLPLLLLVAFLVGLLPMFVRHLTVRWRLRRRLDAAERTLAESQAAAAGIEAAPYAAPPAPLP